MTADNDISDIKNSKFALRQIYFYLTDGCNLRCRHCWISPAYQGSKASLSCSFLPAETFRAILEEAKPLGLTGVKFTGGEPLLHPDIAELITIVRDMGLQLNVETNAVLCTPELARLMASCGSPPHVGVSIDGADQETHEWVRLVDGCFENALQGIKNLTDVGIRPQIVMTIMRRNKDQIADVVRLAERVGASSVKFNILQPTERGEQMVERGEALSIEELIDLGRWVNTELASSTSMKLLYTQPLAFQPLGRMFGSPGGCSICGIKNIVGVLPNGSYALCGIGEKIPELTFGMAGKDKLEDIWLRAKVIREIRDDLPRRMEGICGKCLMKTLCLGSCVAQNFYRRRSLWAPFWYCEEAEKSGLFPATRIPEKGNKP